MKNKLFVLGAQDPEMDLIEEILLKMKYTYVYGSVNGERCNRTNAYMLDEISTEKEVVFIESSTKEVSVNSMKCDHHNEGDYGYNLDYNNFLEAASVGQLLKMILLNDFHIAANKLGFEKIALEFHSECYFFHSNKWHFSKDGHSVIISEDIVFIAGFDHCSADIYKGLCLGIEKEGLIDKRITALAKDLSLEESYLASKFLEYNEIVNSDKSEILDLTHLELGNNYSADYLVIREISLLKSIPIAVKTTTTTTLSQITKLMLLSLSPEQVETFKKEKKFNDLSVNNVFGVPNRGYAGGEMA